ncbi:MAG TPA: GGDEF domain-containing protein [Anaeromyxobacteraceae bacterium]|nr:GGDEF domain-containing protein [Anaeromyxobacteraceae bacterium]
MALGLTLCVGVGDVLTGTEVSFILLYLAPIAFATWFVSLGGGVLLTIASAAVSAAADVIGRMQEGRGVIAPVLAWNVIVQLGTFMALVLLLEALKSRLEGEQLLARTDALTQVPNRRAFIEAATLELERARRSGRSITFAFVDCDDFKFVNDALGHAQGDALLVVVAQTLRSATRAVDAVARLGGDEFGLLLPETDAEVARVLLSRVRGTLDAAMARNGWSVGFSIGAATFALPPRSVDEMMARADELMYEAKRTGKGQIRLETITPATADVVPPAPRGERASTA